ncbi:MAG: hypothetical protein QXI49_06465 [Candidatus Methanomethylicaceae archaeon]
MRLEKYDANGICTQLNEKLTIKNDNINEKTKIIAFSALYNEIWRKILYNSKGKYSHEVNEYDSS